METNSEHMTTCYFMLDVLNDLMVASSTGEVIEVSSSTLIYNE